MVCHWKFRSMKCHHSHCKNACSELLPVEPPLQKVGHPGTNGIFNQRLSFKDFVPIGTSHCHLSQPRCTSSLDPSTAASDECLNDEDRDSLVLDLPLNHFMSCLSQSWTSLFFFAWVACTIMYAHRATANDALWRFHPRFVKMGLLENFLQWKNVAEFGSKFHGHHARCVINFLFDFLITLRNVGLFHCVELFWGWNAAWEQWSGPR